MKTMDLVTLNEEDKDASIEKDIENDLAEARETYKILIEKGKEGLEVAFTVVEETQHPRSVETFATLLNAIASINKNLVDLQTAKRETIKKKAKEQAALPAGNQTLNQIFVGSPADLQELIQGMNVRGLAV